MPDYVEKYICRNGQQVTIEIDDTSYEVSVFDLNRKKVGCFQFKEIDEGSALKLIWCYLDLVNGQYKRQGIGRHIIQLVKERYRMPIVVEDHDGIRQDDGSYLTGDAPVFVAKMRQEGLIEHSK